MWLYLNASGMDIHFRINDYEPSTEDDWYVQWCRCDYSFQFRNYLNYQKSTDEVLLSCEVALFADVSQRGTLRLRGSHRVSTT